MPQSELLIAVPIGQTGVSAEAYIDWTLIGLAIWIIGAAVFLWMTFVKQSAVVQSWKRESELAPSSLSSIVEQAKHVTSCQQHVDICISRHNMGQLVVGLLNPTIYLPRNFCSLYTRRQQYLSLVHELSHVTRGDLWASAAHYVMRALLWWNPVIHYASRAFRTDQESACDAYLLKRLEDSANVRDDYAETLVFAAKQIQPRQILGQAPMCLTIYHPLKERLMVMKSLTANPGWKARLGLATALGATLLLSAPISMADGHKEKLAGDVKSEMTSKQVIKMTEEVDGKYIEKHYEIVSEKGVTQAYKIAKDGTRTKVDMAEIDALNVKVPPLPPIPDVPHANADVDVIIMMDEDDTGKVIEKRVKVLTENHSGQGGDKVFIQKVKPKYYETYADLSAIVKEAQSKFNITSDNRKANQYQKNMVLQSKKKFERMLKDEMVERKLKAKKLKEKEDRRMKNFK